MSKIFSKPRDSGSDRYGGVPRADRGSEVAKVSFFQRMVRPRQSLRTGAMGCVGLAAASLMFLPSAGWAQTSACDVNQDGAVNNDDVTAVRNMALGTQPCTTNITGAGVCNVTTLQRVINASMGQPCLSDTTAVPGLVAAYAFDEGNGTTAADASGNGRTGTLMSGPSWTGGRFGGAVNFDGVDDYIQLPNFDVSGTGLTISAWVKFNTITAEGQVRFLSKATDTSEQAHYWMLGQSVDNRRLRFRLKTGSTTTTLLATSGDLTVNTWYHAAAVYDGSAMRLYLNGTQVGSTAKSGVVSTNGSVPVNIGRNPDGAFPFAGAIDQVRVYDRGLSPAEILADMNTPIGPVTPDTTAPTVSLTSPAAGATLSGTVAIAASASDNVAVAGVQFLLDGANLGSEVAGPGPYAFNWNTTTASNGSHVLSARARDAAGNLTTSTARSVNVSNTTVVPRSVTLNWVSSITPSVLTNVYRASTSGGPYTKLNSTPISGATYVDSSVLSGQTYYYVVRAVDGGGTESVNSNQATAVVASP